MFTTTLAHEKLRKADNLTFDEEYKLRTRIVQARENGHRDHEAINALFVAHEKLIASMVRRYCTQRPWADFDEILSMVQAAVLECTLPSIHNDMSARASTFLTISVQRHIYGTRYKHTVVKFGRSRGYGDASVEELLPGGSRYVPLDVAGHYNEDGDPLSLQYVDPVHSGPQSPYNMTLAGEYALKRKATLDMLLQELSPRDRDIIIGRRLSEPRVPLKDLSKAHKISRERVRQIEKRVYETLEKRARQGGALGKLPLKASDLF